MTCVAGVVPGLVVQPNMMVVFPNKTAVSEVGSSVLEYKFSQLRTSDAGDYTCTATVDIPEAGINSITGSTVGNITVKSELIFHTSKPHPSLHSSTACGEFLRYTSGPLGTTLLWNSLQPHV